MVSPTGGREEIKKVRDFLRDNLDLEVGPVTDAGTFTCKVPDQKWNNFTVKLSQMKASFKLVQAAPVTANA